ncbi:MAG: glycosyltransferase family 4 protein, partial [Anaerolineae bacterium]|nr:glycosyltransferase family 4 protein [Anaerolineae bacterium]
YSTSLAAALRRAGATVTVIAARNSPPLDGVMLHPLLPTVTPLERLLPLKLLPLVPAASRLLHDCDVIHATVEPYAPLAAWAAGRRPAFVSAHGTYVRLPQMLRPPFSWLYRRALSRAALVCVSRYTERVVRETLPGARTLVINNGVDFDRFADVQTLAAKAAQPTILFVGGVKARKGTLELVRAMPAVRTHIADAQCVIIGSLTLEPEYAARVQQAVDEMGLADCVHLLGHVPDDVLRMWFAAAHVFALPSLNSGWQFEGYGLAHLEASAAGLPVIGTRDCGAEDAVDDGVTGLLVSQDRVADELPEAIVQLLRDPALATRMGAAGRAKASQQTWDAVAAAMLDAYQAAL